MKHVVKIIPILLLAWSTGVFAQTNQQEVLSSTLRDHVAILAADSLEGRGLGTAGKLKALDYIATHFEKAGLQTYDGSSYFHEFVIRLGAAMVPATNVVGYLEGTNPDLKDEYIVIGAHLDHMGYEMKEGERVIFNGADDNASGVASLIELAMFLSENKAQLDRSVVFVAFDGEESGLLGSYRFRDENTLIPMDQVKLMFSFDMLGMYAAHGGIDLKGLGILSDGVDVAKKVAEQKDIVLKNVSAEAEARTDTWPFAEIGIPTIHAFTGMKSPYHKPEDTYEKLDYEGMAKVNVFLRQLIIELSALPNLDPSKMYQKLKNPAGLRFNAGLSVYTGGSKHQYPDEFYTADAIFAYSAGAFVQMHLGQKVTLQPEVLYSSAGSKSPEGVFRQQSLSVPVHLHYNLVNQFGGMVKVWPALGGYYKYNFAGKNDGVAIDYQLYNQQEYGLSLGFGLDAMNWQIKYIWQRSLTDLSSVQAQKIYPSAWYISVGYRF